MSTGMIQLTSLSFERIRDDLKAFAQAKPDADQWQDWYEHSNGRVVCEWIAGLATFRAYHEMMRIRESQLDQAQLDSSVNNLAFNKGLLVPPSFAAEMVLTVTLGALRSVSEGDFVATVGGYECYSLEGKTFQAGVQASLRVVVGHLNEFTRDIPGLRKFSSYKFSVSDKFMGQQLERLTVDGAPVTLLSDPDYLNDVANDFMLRRVMTGQARVYTGNGIIGWYQGDAQRLVYRVLSYGTDVSAAVTQTPALLLAGTLDDWDVVLQAAFDPNKEEIREIARFYPVDGRVVQDNDYSVIIKKNFGGILVDCYSFNTDPDQRVHILKDINFGTGAEADAYLERIKALINVKRALGMDVYYYLKDREEGKTFTVDFRVSKGEYSNDLVNRVNAFLNKRVYRFWRKAETLTATTLAIELSAEFGVEFYPTGSETIVLTATDFLKSFTVTAHE